MNAECRPQAAPESPAKATTDMVAPAGDYPPDWREQLAQRVNATVARKARQKATRREFAAARRYGLAARHAAKLRRSGGGP